MKLDVLALLLAALAGAIMAFQGAVNAALGKIVGLLEATFIVMIIGLLTAFIALFPLRLGHGDIFKFTGAPWYSFMGGMLIVLITYAVAASIPKIGAANATTAIVAAQVTTAFLIDHFGLFGLQAIPFSWWKAAGLALLVVGTRLMLLQ
ncbi:MAG TPA: DMT family transporter [Firmicutes bacterium]|jgi:transporter family-2 protein|nr:DMT family transporter [Bacillota bacterium]